MWFTMRWIATISAVRNCASAAETAIITAISASCADSEGKVSGIGGGIPFAISAADY